MSEKKRRLLIALLVAFTGGTFGCDHDKPPAPVPQPGPVKMFGFTPPPNSDVKDTPIIIADGTAAINQFYIAHPAVASTGHGGAAWAPGGTTGSFTITLTPSSYWLIADGGYEILNPSATTSYIYAFPVGSQTLTFSFNYGTTPVWSVTVAPKTSADPPCTADTSQHILQCSGAVYGSSFMGPGTSPAQHYPTGAPTRQHFLFIAQ